MSEFVKRLEEKYRNIPIANQLETYYELLAKIKEAKKEYDLDKLFVFSQMSLGLLDALIKNTKKEYGCFDIVEIPALDEGFFIAVVRGLKGQIHNFKDVVSYYKELEQWKIAFEKIERLSEVVEYIKTHSACLYKNLKQKFDIKPSLIGRCLIYMESCGLIRKEKEGRSFKIIWIE